MDRLGDSAKKGLDFLKSRAKETVEVQKLSSTAKQLEERRLQCLIDLGHRVVAAHGTEDFQESIFTDRVEEVQKLTAELEKVQQEHEETKTHLRQSMEELLPKRSGPPIPPPEYD